MNRHTLVPLLIALVLVTSVAAQPVVESAEAAPANGLTDVRSGDHGGYERAVLDFRASTAPEFSRSYRNGDTVVRVRLPETRSTDISGGKVAGDAISHYRVVRTKPGSLFVDLHLEGAARSVEVFALDRPGRIVVDVTPGGTQLRPGPKSANGTYIMSPRSGAAVGPGEFRVGGYGRPFEASGVWRVKDSDGRVVSRGNYKAADWADTWGAYGFKATYPERLGGERGALQVGQLSARDGSFEGAAVPVTFR